MESFWETQLQQLNAEHKRLMDERVILSLEIGKLHSEFAKHKQEAAELAEWKSRANAENGTVSYLTRRLELLEHELKEERARSLALRRASGPEAGPSAEKQRPGRASLDDAPEFKLQLDPVGISKWATLTAPIPVHGVLPVKCDEGEAYLVIARDSNGLFERDTVVFEGETLTPAEFLRRMGHQRVPTWQTALRVKMEDGSEMSVFDWEEKRSCGLVCGNKVIFVERTRRGPPRAVTPPSTDAPPPAPLDSPTARRRAHTNALPAADPVRSSPRLRNSAGAGPTPTARPPTTKTARALSLAPKRKRREDGAEGCAAPAVAGAGGGPAETCAICWVDLPAAVNTKSGRRREAAALEAARKSSAPDLTAVSKLQCAHRFHRSCIQKWIDKCNTCPTCRKEVAEFEGKPLHARNALADDGGALGAVDDIVCAVCSSGENEELLVLCDGCNVGAHIFCLDPPLAEVPMENWYCRICQETRPAGAGAGTAPQPGARAGRRRAVDSTSDGVVVRGPRLTPEEEDGAPSGEASPEKKRRKTKGRDGSPSSSSSSDSDSDSSSDSDSDSDSSSSDVSSSSSDSDSD